MLSAFGRFYERVLSAFGQFYERGGRGVLSAFGRFYERGGGGGGAVRFWPIKRAGGGVLSACVRNTRFLDKRGGCKPQNPLKLRAKKKEFGQKGGLQPPTPPPPPPLYHSVSAPGVLYNKIDLDHQFNLLFTAYLQLHIISSCCRPAWLSVLDLNPPEFQTALKWYRRSWA